MARKKIANYNANPNYLDYLDALRKFFTNDTDILPIVMEFNFYINGVYNIPYTDLFRQYLENLNDIHGEEKTKSLIDDGTIGIINDQIYKNGNGSLIQSLESLRVYILDRLKSYNISWNPITMQYIEIKKLPVTQLQTSNPEVINNNDATTSGEGALTEDEIIKAKIEQGVISEPLRQAPPNAEKKHRKSFWQHLGFLSYKNSARYKKIMQEKGVRYYDGNNY